MRPRDSQRAKVYSWERQNVPEFYKTTTLDECRRFTEKVCKDIQLSAVDVTDGRGRRSACAYAHRICLPTYARTKPIVLHELAHCVIQQGLGRGEVAPHGPEFMRVYMWLLQKYCKQPLRQLQSTAKKSRVKYASPQVVDKVRSAFLVRYIHSRLNTVSFPVETLDKIRDLVR